MKMPLPRELGFFVPPEWEAHRATWLAWPRNPDTWPGVDLERVEPAWAEMAKALVPQEEVNILASADLHARIGKILKKYEVPQSRVLLRDIPTNDAWMRDAGPIFLTCPKDPREPGSVRRHALTDWEFNKWGGKYPPWDLDNLIPEKIAKLRGLQRFVPGMVLEGGSIDLNGKGALLTTEQCLLNENRNPSLSRSEIEQKLRDYLGVTRILWLGEGIAGDDTDGHVDDLARFVSPTTIVTVVEKDPGDENYKPLQENLKRLAALRDQDGKPFKILHLPMPRPLYHTDGLRLPASYANFYIANGVVLLPVFGDPRDAEATGVLRQALPGRRVVPIDCRDVIVGLGALHCVTQQEPI